jgi:hypothetical protein
MNRRRITAIAGAIGLLGWLVSSGVAVRADLPGLDSTMSNLISTYLTSSQDLCYASSGTAVPAGGTCTITETTPTGKNNIAICVQSKSVGPTEMCTITQKNTTFNNNYAFVVQHLDQNCSPPPPKSCQTATIIQDNDSGKNFAAIFNDAKHSTDASDPQMLSQDGTIRQNDDSGSDPCVIPATTTGDNFAELDQTSDQFGQSNTGGQSQISTQGGEIDQCSKGISRASASQNQQQKLVGPGSQFQQADPHCCSAQQDNPENRFDIKQSFRQAALKAGSDPQKNPSASQFGDDLGNCESTGLCTFNQSGSDNKGSFSTTTTCTAPCPPSNHSCFIESGSGSCPPGTFASVGFATASQALTFGQATVGRAASSGNRSAPSGALLT